MKTSVSTGKVSLLPAPGAGWGVKIGAETGGGTEKGLQIRTVGKKS